MSATGDVAGDRVERLLRRLDRGDHSPLRQPRPRSQRPAGLGDRRGDPREASSSDRRPLESHLALGERPGREVDVRVGEPGKDAAAAEVDALGARSAVSWVPTPPAIRSPAIASAARRQGGVEGPDDAVLEDHARAAKIEAAARASRPSEMASAPKARGVAKGAAIRSARRGARRRSGGGRHQGVSAQSERVGAGSANPRRAPARQASLIRPRAGSRRDAAEAASPARLSRPPSAPRGGRRAAAAGGGEGALARTGGAARETGARPRAVDAGLRGREPSAAACRAQAAPAPWPTPGGAGPGGGAWWRVPLVAERSGFCSTSRGAVPGHGQAVGGGRGGARGAGA